MPKSASSPDSRYAVPALEKGMRILEDLAIAPEPLGIAEIADRQGRGRNEIYRMVNCLQSLGYLTRHPDTKRYSLSLRLFQLANSHPPLARLRQAAEPRLQQLADTIGESCHMCMLNGDDVAVIAQAAGSERIRITFQLGARFDPLETCSGKLMLSEMEAEEHGLRLERSALWAATPPDERAKLASLLARKRRDRVWQEASRLRAGVRDIAVAIGSPDGLLATLAVAHLADRPQAAAPQTIVRELKRSAADIERQLGFDHSNHIHPHAS